ncbi:MAG: hypothetical protein Q9167_000848 [Letrouitia subvulpina]
MNAYTTTEDVLRFRSCQAYIPAYNPINFAHLYHWGRLGGLEQPLEDDRAGRNRRAATGLSNSATSRTRRGNKTIRRQSTKVPPAHGGTEAAEESPGGGDSTKPSRAHADTRVLERSLVNSNLEPTGSPLARPWANLAMYQFQTLQIPISHQGSVKRRHSEVEASEDLISTPLTDPSGRYPAGQVPASPQVSVKIRRVRAEASEDPVFPLSVGPSAYPYRAPQVPTSHQGSIKRRRVRVEASEDPVSPPPASLSSYQGPATQIQTPHQASSRRRAAASEGSKSRVPPNEQLLIKQLVQEQIDKGNHTERKWKDISDELKARHNINRNFTSVKNFWNRHGREKFGLDERKNKNPAKMITSMQDPGDRKRAREEKKASKDSAQRQTPAEPNVGDDGTNAAEEGYGYTGSGTVTDPFNLDAARRQYGKKPQDGEEGYGYGGSGTLTDPFNVDAAQRRYETKPQDDDNGINSAVEGYGYGGSGTVVDPPGQVRRSGTTTNPFEPAR